MSARRIVIALLVLAFCAGVLIGGALWFAFSDAGLRYAIEEAIAKSKGKLTIEGATGSLGGTTRAARLTYTDDDLMLVADGVTLALSPRALLSRTVRVEALSAVHITLELKPSAGPRAPPASLVLPVLLEIDRAAVGELEIASTTNRWRFTQLAFRYAGGGERHTLDDVAVGTDLGAFRGGLGIDAQRPFATRGRITFDGSAALRRANGEIAIGGDLSTIALEARASAAGARIVGTARVAPFDPVWLRAFELEGTDIDLARFDATLPRTALAASFAGSGEAGTRVRGRIAAKNSDTGPLSAQRLPIVEATSAIVLDADGIAFDDLVADLEGGGRISGSGRLGAAETRWNLRAYDVDLHRIVTSLKPTRLAGHVDAHLRIGERGVERRGEFRGELSERGVTLAFDAAIRGDVAEVASFRAQAHGGTVAGRATFDLSGAQRFTVAATATRLNPAVFGDYPGASLSGTFSAHGSLKPDWSAAVALKLADGSRFSGRPLSGGGTLEIAPQRVHSAEVELALGSNHLKVSGDFGHAGDLLAFALDARDLAAIDPQLGGRLQASGRVGGAWTQPSIVFSASAETLRLGSSYSVRTLRANAEIGAVANTTADGDRAIRIDAAAAGARTETVALTAATVAINGTIGRHDATLTVQGGDLDLSARFAGGWQGDVRSGAWSGRVLALENRGAYPLVLREPATFEWRRGRTHLANARGELAGGRFALRELLWDAGRLSSAGEFSALPAAPLVAASGYGERVRSTLTLSGRWSFAATPRLNGTLTVTRDSGDVAPVDAPELALGLARVELVATSVDDHVHAVLGARSRFADADFVADLGASPETTGRFGADAPLSLSARVDAVSMRALQSLAGTNAIVDGRLRLDLAGHGTLGRVRLNGAIDGDALKIEAPQYGLYLKEGRLRARLADDALTVGELSFTAGEGKFVASGTLPAIAGREATRAEITWKADKLKLLNRPDMRLTLSGAGTLALERQRVALAGALKADEGYFEFRRTDADTLGEDVMVRGRERKPSRAGIENVPLAVDLDLDFGDRFAFVGEGLDAELTGKVRIATIGNGLLTAKGAINTERGTYTAFGQRLTIERGKLYFEGPLDNPGLDLLALRKNLPVEAGVEVTGTVRAPRVVLTSNPPVSDNEKLSWLVLGQGLDRVTGADAAALQAALYTLTGSGGAPFGQRIARSVGLDDISVRSGDPGRTGTASQIVAVSKRLTDNISLIYEQGLSVANNALKIEYALTRNVTVRAEAGAVSGIGIYYSKSYD